MLYVRCSIIIERKVSSCQCVLNIFKFRNSLSFFYCGKTFRATPVTIWVNSSYLTVVSFQTHFRSPHFSKMKPPSSICFDKRNHPFSSSTAIFVTPCMSLVLLLLSFFIHLPRSYRSRSIARECCTRILERRMRGPCMCSSTWVHAVPKTHTHTH